MPTKKNITPEETVQPDEGEVPQTETNLETEERNNPEESGNSELNAQTDLESESDKENSPEDAEEAAVSEASDQTDTETEEKPRTRRRKTAEPVSENNNISPEDPEPAEPRRTRTRSDRTSPVLSIDDQRTVETDADKARNDLLDLLESQKSGKILSGTIQGVERSDNQQAHSLAVIYHGEYKVIIPAEEAVDPPEDYRGMLPQDVLHYMLTKRLGAEVDYIVKGIDAAENIAVASRLEAMRAKRRQYYLATDRDGNNLIYSDICAEARVVSVIRAGVFVELFGLEVYIPLRELSYQRWLDASGHFQPGQRILVKILSVDRSDRDHIKVTASVKQAGENPYEKALRRYSVGNRYVGTVSMVDTNGVFVALDGGIDCLCSYPKRGRPPRGARVTVRILGINHDSNRIWGAITHIATAR